MITKPISTPRMLALEAFLLLATPVLAQEEGQPPAPAVSAPAPAPAQSRTADVPEPARVIVLPGAEAGADGALSREAASRLLTALSRLGHPIVDLEQAEVLEGRIDKIIQESFGAAEPKPAPPASDRDQKLCRQALAADVIVRVAVEPDTGKKQQGRYRVNDRLRVKMVSADDPLTLLSETLEADGQSFDGYAQAHRDALDKLCTTDAGAKLTQMIEGKLREVSAKEQESGVLYTVGITADRDDLVLVKSFASQIAGIGRVDPSSVNLVASGTQTRGDKAKISYSEYTLRFKGRSYDLREALQGIIDKETESLTSKTAEKIVPTFVTSRRRVELILHTIPANTSLAQQIETAASDVASKVYEGNRGYLDGKKLAVVPTSISAADATKGAVDSFGRDFWSEYERIEKQAADKDPLDFGPVTIQGKLFNSLREARGEFGRIAQAYYASEAGNLAMTIARVVGDGFIKASSQKVDVLVNDVEQENLLDVIKKEAEIYKEEGAVNPQSIAFLERPGAQAALLTSLKRFLDSYRIQVAIVDLKTGAAVRADTTLEKRLTKELDEHLK